MVRRSAALTEAVTQDSRLFAEFDEDKKLSLDVDEFHRMMPAEVAERFSREQIRSWFAQADRSGNGIINVDEFFLWSLAIAMQHYGPDSLAKVFEKYDADATGQLDEIEFGRVCHDLGFGAVSSTIFSALDNDRGGTVSYRELVSLLIASREHSDASSRADIEALEATWNAAKEENIALDGGVDTSGWSLKARDAVSVQAELRALLKASSGRVADLLRLFDEDANRGSATSISFKEFAVCMRQRLGFKGSQSVLVDIFGSLDSDHGGCIGFDEVSPLTNATSARNLVPGGARVLNMFLFPRHGICLRFTPPPPPPPPPPPFPFALAVCPRSSLNLCGEGATRSTRARSRPSTCGCRCRLG
jgi:Ca2+-binding EF-hand superfamily protein